MNIFKDDPKTKKGKVLLITGVALAGVIVGSLGGVLFSFLLKNPQIDLSNIKTKEDNYDVEELQKSVQKDLQDGKDITKEYSLSEIAHYALDNFKASKYSVAFGYGVANSAINLDIRNCTIRNDNLFMEEALSKSQPGIIDVKVCQRDYQDGVNEDSPIKSYRGDLKDAETPIFDNPSLTDYTYSSYKDVFGKTLDDPSVYVVSSKTILTDKVPQKDPSTGNDIYGNSRIEKVDSGYRLYMELSTLNGVTKYYKRMMNLSNSNVSVFNYVHLTYNLNDKFELISSYVEESYAAGIGTIKATVLGNLTTYFFKDTTDYLIPDINNYISYPKQGELR